MPPARLARLLVFVPALAAFSAGPSPPPPPSDPAALEQRAAELEKKADLSGAAAALREALALRRSAGEIPPAAADLQRLGSIEMRTGDLDGSERDWKECLEIRRRLAPRTREEASAWNGLGAVAYLRGDLDGADQLYGKALAIHESAAPDSVDAARTTANLGLVAFSRGDLDRAESFFQRALATFEKIDPAGVEMASPLNYLGVVAKNRGDYDSAEQYYVRARAIFEKRNSGSLSVAGIENNLGVLCKERGDFECGERHHRAALEIRRRLASDSYDVAASLNNLAEIALLRGNPDAALPFIRESLDIKERIAPRSLSVASGLVNLADYHLRKGDPAQALADARRALEIRRRLAPGTLDEAEAFALVARSERAGGDLAGAAQDYRQALTAVEAQRRRLGGADEERAAFSTRSIGYYRETIDLLHELRRDDEAFEVLERSRASTSLALSGQRDLRVDANAPADLLRERGRLDSLYDRAQQQIGRIDPVGRKEEADRLVARLLDLREQRAAVEEKIWASSPRTRELENPRTLTLAEARRALDPGTAVLSFSVGEKRTLLFAIPADAASPLAVWEVPVGSEEAARGVEVFRNLIRQEKDDASVKSARDQAGRRLYRTLLAPASGVIARSRRLLVCPDGALHLLPFGALTVVGRPGGKRYLAEGKPLHVALSATLAIELARRRVTTGKPSLELAAFGDPAPAGDRADRRALPASVPVAERARSLGALPESRDEVGSVAALFRGTSESFTGVKATESRVTATIGGARYVHFACHAILDSHFPLDSALVLAAPEVDRPGDDNGLLQAWEIYERVHLRADLVTLSACETALGRNSGGEGLVGLVRAFHFAGARSVLASLWNISDRSTPEFMTRFYRALRNGRPADEALQEAQRGSMKTGAAPYSWAAFELFGDWK